MELRLHDLYTNLPFLSNVKDSMFYVPGYTEVLRLVEGVKVLPEYYEEFIPVQFRKLFSTSQYPAYWIPIKQGNKHFGFIIKSYDKQTSRFSTYYPYFNLDSLLSPLPYVFVVEGIKDAGMFLENGHPTMSMLTSGMADERAAIFILYKKIPIFVTDNDAPGREGVAKVMKFLKAQNHLCFSVTPNGHKDMGNYYDSRNDPAVFAAVQATYRRAMAVVNSIMSSKESTSLIHSQGKPKSKIMSVMGVVA